MTAKRSSRPSVNSSETQGTSSSIVALSRDRPSSPNGASPGKHSIRAALGEAIGSNVHIGNKILVRSSRKCHCIETLTLVDPKNDKKRIEKTKGGLLRDCYCWVLENGKYERWLSGESPRLWISGDAGKGKTMLLCGIITELEASLHPTRQALAYFFCEATDNQRNSATAVLRGLIGSLVTSTGLDHDSWPEIHEQHKKSRGLYYQDVNAWHILEQIFDSLLQTLQLSGITEVILLVDALDECVVDKTHLWNLVCRPSSIKIKWIVSSRNHAGIVGQLRQAGTVELNLESRSASSFVAAAVRNYISYKGTKLLSHLPEPRKKKLLHFMQSNASGTFLWVSLLFKAHLEGRIIGWNHVNGVVDLPPELDAYYQRMIDDIDDRCVEVINVMLFVCRPVSLAELSVILGWDECDDIDWKKIISACGSFLTLQPDWRTPNDNVPVEENQNTTVNFVHTSAKDFILKQRESEQGFAQLTHQAIAERLLSYMTNRLRRNFYGLCNPAYSMTDLVRPDPDPLEPFRYACVYWTEHLSKAQVAVHERDVVAAVGEFLRRRSLNWIEALSLTKEISAGITTLRTLHHLLEALRPGSEVAILAQDLHRLLWSHRCVLEEHPLQVYSSALLFSALRQTTRAELSRQKSDWMLTDSVVKYEWEPCLQTIEGHGSCINTVASPPDSLLLASGSCDKTVRIWREGELLNSFEHSDDVLCICFSPDVQYIATGSRGKMLKVWHVDTGQRYISSQHRSPVTSIAFSNDSTRLFSGTQDGSIRVISLKRGSEASSDSKGWVGKGAHDERVNSACFSADGTRIAWGTEQGNIVVWYLNRGPKPQVSLNHGSPVRAIYLRPDGTFLVSVAQDGSINTWDIRDIRDSSQEPRSRIMLAPTAAGITTASFSSDGTRLVSSSCDTKCLVWCAMTGECLAILGGEGRSIQSHQKKVNAAVFFKRDTCVISGSEDTTVKIWDLEQETVSQPPEHGSRVTSTSISRDGMRLVTGSTDKAVKVWDASTAECFRTLQGHTGSITAVAFSADGRLVASGSYDSTARIWDLGADDGSCKTTKSTSGHITALGFSNSGGSLAFGLNNGTIAIWDLSSEMFHFPDKSHDSAVTSVAFSICGAQLVSSSRDGTVKIWNLCNLGKYALQKTLNLGREVQSVRFDQDSPRLLTDSSIVCIEPESVSSPGQAQNMFEVTEFHEACGYSISLDKRWVTLNGHNLMSLPFNYRPSCMATVGGTMFIGCESGQVFTIRFLSEMFPQYV